jgi:hypothetical protein
MACKEWKPVAIALVIIFAKSSTVGLPVRRRGSTSCWSRRRTWERNEREVRVKSAGVEDERKSTNVS